jgi:hypothetical protein
VWVYVGRLGHSREEIFGKVKETKGTSSVSQLGVEVAKNQRLAVFTRCDGGVEVSEEVQVVEWSTSLISPINDDHGKFGAVLET